MSIESNLEAIFVLLQLAQFLSLTSAGPFWASHFEYLHPVQSKLLVRFFRQVKMASGQTIFLPGYRLSCAPARSEILGYLRVFLLGFPPRPPNLSNSELKIGAPGLATRTGSEIAGFPWVGSRICKSGPPVQNTESSLSSLYKDRSAMDPYLTSLTRPCGFARFNCRLAKSGFACMKSNHTTSYPLFASSKI
jgi:hypothetical protein